MNAGSSNKVRCLIWGGYGGGNVGDELTLALGVVDMRRRYGDGFAILSGTPGYTMALFPDVTVIPYVPHVRAPGLGSAPVRALNRLYRYKYVPANRYDAAAQADAAKSRPWAGVLRQCELLYLVGGGYLNDLFDFDLFCLPIEAARHFGVKIETAPVGVGPFREPQNATRLREALAGATVLVRDVDSQALCESWGLRPELGRDDGFRVTEAVAMPPRTGRDKPLIGLCYHRQHGGAADGREVVWWRELLGLLKGSGLPLEGFCFHNTIPDNFSPMVQLFTEAGLPGNLVRYPDWDFRDACRRVAGYTAVVTSRFHGAVVAGAVGVPTFAVVNGQYYGSKMTAACKGVAGSTVADLSVMKPADVVRRLEQLVTTSTHA